MSTWENPDTPIYVRGRNDGIQWERERVARIIRERVAAALRVPNGHPAYVHALDAVLVALGVEDNQPGTTP